MASPRLAQWAEQGVDILARPWPHSGTLFTQHDCMVDCARRQVPCPGGQCVPMVPGRHVQVPAAACDACAVRAQCPKATHGHGRSLRLREDAQCQQTWRAQLKTPRGRASLRQRTAVAQAISHQLAPQGRRARSKG
jgi:Transposase DDE domain